MSQIILITFACMLGSSLCSSQSEPSMYGGICKGTPSLRDVRKAQHV